MLQFHSLGLRVTLNWLLIHKWWNCTLLTLRYGLSAAWVWYEISATLIRVSFSLCRFTRLTLWFHIKMMMNGMSPRSSLFVVLYLVVIVNHWFTFCMLDCVNHETCVSWMKLNNLQWCDLPGKPNWNAQFLLRRGGGNQCS